MQKHTKKIIAPVIIVCILVLYYLLWLTILWEIKIALLARVLFLVIPAGIIAAMIFVLLERIKEIKSGEEDDLGKY